MDDLVSLLVDGEATVMATAGADAVVGIVVTVVEVEVEVVKVTEALETVVALSGVEVNATELGESDPLSLLTGVLGTCTITSALICPSCATAPSTVLSLLSCTNSRASTAVSTADSPVTPVSIAASTAAWLGCSTFDAAASAV